MAARSILVAVAVLTVPAALPTGGASATAATVVKANAAQMFALADEARLRGDNALAETIYRTMFADVSAEVGLEAHFRLAALETKRGNLAKAAILLRQVVDARPTAAPARLALAQLLDRMGDRESAWRQIRAMNASGLPPAVARLIDRYSQALRGQRPFGASLEVAVAPDSNINRATRSDTLGTVLGDFEIGPEGKAKSGTGLALNGQMYRRLPLGGDSDLLVRASGFANLYRHKAFDDVAADLAIGPELNLGRNRLQLELGATQRWYGLKPFMRSARVGATLSHPLGGRAFLRLSGTTALIDNQLNDLEDGRSFSGQASVERALGATTGVAATLGIDRRSLRNPGYSTTGWRGGLTAWRDVGRMTLTVGAELGRLGADERLALFPHKRSDRYSRLSMGATFRQLEWRGFAPVLRFSIERNRSSVEFYDYRRTRTEMGVVRAF
ncbi:surface lipoprotein assembly modifier [Sphingomonas sp.]|uniref:surface lipoprotein assembly modifier n=1 Tax=Sphingomonas sp. TaxID=28214 RepID=UPI0038A433E2